PQNLDVFFIGTDGNVYSSFWNGSSGVDASGLPNWANPFATTTGRCINTSTSCAGSGQPGGAIAAVSRTTTNIDVFYVRKDGGVGTTFWSPAAGWTTMEIAGPSSRGQPIGSIAPPGAGIAATARTSTNLDVFFVGSDGGLWTSAWSNSGGWGTFETKTSQGTGLAGGPVSAVARQPGNLDVLYQGSAKLMWSSWSSHTPWTSTVVGVAG